jgi:hypothetical protein
MDEPKLFYIVSWRDPRVARLDVDFLVKEYPVGWRSLGSGEVFLWEEVVQLAERAGVELHVWRKF